MRNSTDIYTGHFGLRERPFSLVPDPSFLFWTPAHRRAFAVLEYGIVTRAPITMVTGEIGTGKTTLVRYLLETIGDEATVGLMSNVQGGRGELLRWVLASLGHDASPQATYVDLYALLESVVVGEYARGRRVILIVDEAQNLLRDSIEELRTLTNINSNKDEVLQVVLVGQPELRDRVSRADMSQFAQRVGATFHLEPMDEPAVEAYIDHRLRVAGATRQIFHRGAARLIRQTSDGVPRLVNQLCDLSMVYAFVAGDAEVTPDTVGLVLNDDVVLGSYRLPVMPSLRRARQVRGTA
jgi:general secretion pathway protein A